MNMLNHINLLIKKTLLSISKNSRTLYSDSQTKSKTELLTEIENLKKQNSELIELSKQKIGFEDGHFYSPIPDLNVIKKLETRIFNSNFKPRDINLSEKSQILLLKSLSTLSLGTTQWLNSKKKRYVTGNPNFGHLDSCVLNLMIRTFKPKKIIEVGSGYSSCVILDTNELFFKNKIRCSFIEPFPKLLHKLIRKTDKKSIEIIPKKLQDVSVDFFRKLNKNDFLFIDSTHVSKIGSDVNYLFFEILPNLKKGVFIHIHDIFYPFEYPKNWVYEGRFWNENYLLRAFLQNNNNYKIIFFNNFIYEKYNKALNKFLPIASMSSGGSIWLKKVA